MTDQHPMFARVDIPVRHRLNREDKASGTLGDGHQTALGFLRNAGPMGLTWGELAEKMKLHHGQVSSILSDLHRVGRATRLAGKGSLRPGTRSSIYLLPEFVEGRDTATYGGTKASAALKALPEKDAQIAELEKELALFRSRETTPDNTVALQAELDQLKATLQAEVEHHTRTINALGALKEETDRVRLSNESLRRIRDAMGKEQFEADQILGKVLNFPEAFPDVSDVDDGSVVTGEHTIVSLAQQAANHIEELRSKVDGLTVDLMEADQRASNLRSTLETEREAAQAARPVMPSTTAEEREFIDKVRKAVTGKPDTQIQPTRVGSLKNLLVLVDRLHRS